MFAAALFITVDIHNNVSVRLDSFTNALLIKRSALPMTATLRKGLTERRVCSVGRPKAAWETGSRLRLQQCCNLLWEGREESSGLGARPDRQTDEATQGGRAPVQVSAASSEASPQKSAQGCQSLASDGHFLIVCPCFQLRANQSTPGPLPNPSHRGPHPRIYRAAFVCPWPHLRPCDTMRPCCLWPA